MNDGPESRLAWEWDPAEWARKAAAGARRMSFLLIRTGVIVTLATNTSYAYDAEGESLREIPVRLPGQLRQTSTWWLDVAHNQWSMPPGVLLGRFSPPLSEQDVKTLCDAMGFIYGGPGTFWVLLDLEPDLVFARPRPVRPPAEDTSAMRHKAKEAVEDLTAAWRDRPAHEGSALVGTPTFKERYSGRTGWHIRITLDQEKTEVPLRQGDTDKDVRARVEAAVAKMRAKYQPGPARRPLPPVPSRTRGQRRRHRGTCRSRGIPPSRAARKERTPRRCRPSSCTRPRRRTRTQLSWRAPATTSACRCSGSSPGSSASTRP